ncbi:dehydrogenase [Mycobacterium sp. CBMA 234]|uniref:zinc-dependent alcohol dehydrogenase n=1 Tax=Mycolicibacterium sp. CBMA 234 TaxID=1918495 RepID=UPI001EE4EAD8|nr:alcohol dehydrogenase catalytic domain-containing protein [Mycolicibacterium sp. CBMA 234]MUL67165.1 dehydrogenase [Mycolicibacterium sp. CBMA 234]
MPALTLVGTAAVRWDEVPAPVIAAPDQAIVRPIAVATCDLDVLVLRGAYPLPGPYPLGHEGVAVVVEVGEDVRNVAVGDQVIVPFQISCGACDPCLRGRTGNCASHPRMSTFGLGPMGGLHWGGLLADSVLVPHADAMLVPLPEGIDPAAVASASDNIPDGWRAVGPQLAAEPGAEVLVVGGPGGTHSIGLYAAGLAVAAGAGRVVYLDDDEQRLQIAAHLGSEVIEGPPAKKVGAFPITVDASGAEAGLACALNSTAADGTCTSTSVYLKDPKVPMFAMYSRCCTLHTGRAHVRPAIPTVLKLVADGRFDPSLVTTTRADWDDAVDALTEPTMKVVLSRPPIA